MPSFGDWPELSWSPNCQNRSPAMAVVFSAVCCHGFSSLQWFEVTPYSSNRQGLPAALHAAPCELTQPLPQAFVVPQLSGYRWNVPKSIVGMARFFSKSEPSEYW